MIWLHKAIVMLDGYFFIFTGPLVSIIIFVWWLIQIYHCLSSLSIIFISSKSHSTENEPRTLDSEMPLHAAGNELQPDERARHTAETEQLLENCERLITKTELPSEDNEGHETENERLLRNNQGH